LKRKVRERAKFRLNTVPERFAVGYRRSFGPSNAHGRISLIAPARRAALC
jgi:hypothetical protein